MKRAYLAYYDKPSPMAPLRFVWDQLFARNPDIRASLQNRARDYSALSNTPDLLPLHRRLNEIILDGTRDASHYDYGEGYFYQSLAAIGVSGLRDTDKRVDAMDLETWVAGKSVLEVGCNTGFLSARIAGAAKNVVAFDITPHLIEIARVVAQHLDIGNVDYSVSSFEDFQTDERFDVVLSFANHSTFDGQTKNTLEEYFDKCRMLCADGGLLLFESHVPAYEGDGLDQVVDLIGERFEIVDRKVLEYGDFLDRGRTFVVAKKFGGCE